MMGMEHFAPPFSFLANGGAYLKVLGLPPVIVVVARDT